MHVQVRQAFLETDSDTVVDPQRLRRRRRARGLANTRPEDQEEQNSICDALGRRGNPGATMARSALTAVRVREAIVRRNHTIDRAERAPRRASSVKPMTLVRVDWVRARDTGLRVERTGPDTFTVSGRATGCVPMVPVAPGRRASSGPKTPALSLGVDGLLFTQVVGAGEDAQTCVRRWAERLGARFEIEVTAEGDAVHVRLVRARAFA